MRVIAAVLVLLGGLFVGSAAGPAVAVPDAPVVPQAPAAFGYFPMSPERLLDTRPGTSTVDGGGGKGIVDGGATIELQVTGRGTVPAEGVGAVALNVTVAGGTSSGYVTVWPADEAMPLASNLNYLPGQTVPNMVIAALGTDGKVWIHNESLGGAYLIVDIMGWFPEGAPDYTAMAPERFMDTRPDALTIDGQGPHGKISAGATVDLQISGRGSVPPRGRGGASAVVVNVTATDPTATGYVTVWPTGDTRPTASNLNFPPGGTVPNLVIAELGTDGQISLFNGSSGQTDLIADVMGWFSDGADYTPLVPERLMDSRPGQPTIDNGGPRGVIPGGTTVGLDVVDRGSVPAEGVGAVVLNVTTTGPTGNGYVTVWPNGRDRPLASNLNYVPGQTVANLVIAEVGDDGKVNLFNGSAGTTNLIVDVMGWFPPAAPPEVGPFTYMRAGGAHVCAVTNTGEAVCWGEGADGRLGDGTTSNRNVPTRVQTEDTVLEGKTIADISAGGNHSCAVTDEGVAACWGYNDFGQLGDGTNTTSLTPVAVQTAGTPLEDERIARITAGRIHTCAVTEGGVAACWGVNSAGGLGDGTNTSSNVPVAVTTVGTPLEGKTVTWIDAGSDFTCAVTGDGVAACWGAGVRGQLGDGAQAHSYLPVAAQTSGTPLEGKQVTDIAAGYGRTQAAACAVTSDGIAVCWGDNSNGQLGDGTYDLRTVPVAVQTTGTALEDRQVIGIDTGLGNTCAVTSDGTVSCWGVNYNGQLGDGTTGAGSPVPLAVHTDGSVLEDQRVAHVTTSTTSASVLTVGDAAASWGDNGLGQLGDGTFDQSEVPVAIDTSGL